MPEPGDKLLNVKEIAELLEVRTTTVYMVDRFNIPHIRVRDSIRFRRADVKRFLNGTRSAHRLQFEGVGLFGHGGARADRVVIIAARKPAADEPR